MSSGRERNYDVDRERMLAAYLKVTPPRTPEQDKLREQLFAVIRTILGTDAKPLPKQLTMGERGRW